VFKPSLGTRNLGDDVKPRHVGCIYNDIRAHIIPITLYMLGLGGVIGGFYEPNKVVGRGIKHGKMGMFISSMLCRVI